MQPDPLSWELGWYFMLLPWGRPLLGQGWGQGASESSVLGRGAGRRCGAMLVVNRVLPAPGEPLPPTTEQLPLRRQAFFRWGCLAFLEISLSLPEAFSLLLT